MSRKMSLAAYIATCYPLGLMPKAPGTFGSLPGLALGLGIYSLSHNQNVMPSWLMATVTLLAFHLYHT